MKSSGQEKALLKKLDRGRKHIGLADREIIRSLASRFRAVEEVSRIKKQLNLGVVQKAQWRKVIARATESARKNNLPPAFVKGVYGLIHKEAIRRQKVRAANKKRSK